MEQTPVPPFGDNPPLTGLDSYHRFIRQTHDDDHDEQHHQEQQQPPVPPVPPSTSRPFVANTTSFSMPRPAMPWRVGDPSEATSSSSPYHHIASFFDSERLANAQRVDETRPPLDDSRNGIKTRWPFLGSIRSHASSRRSRRTPRATPPPPPTAEGTEAIEKPAPGTSPRLPWRPLFLHRRVLAAFAALFAILVAGLEVALFVSTQNDGLRKSNDAARYLWQYGSTLVFTVVAAVWARVEYQTKASAPWMRLSKTANRADKSLLLDYVSMPEIQVVAKALQNRDLLVFGPVACGILLKTVIVFSTAFVTPSIVRVSNEQVGIMLGANFSGSSAGLENVRSLPYITMAGLQTTNATFPEGVSTSFAYQPFVHQDWDTTILNATVMGFMGSMDCQRADMELREARVAKGPQISLDITASTDNCTTTHAIQTTRFQAASDAQTNKFLFFRTGGCNRSAEPDAQRIVAMAGRIDFDTSSLPSDEEEDNVRIDGTFIESAALVCVPRYSIARVNVVKNATDMIAIYPVDNKPDVMVEGIHPWDIVRALLESFRGHAEPNSSYFSGARSFYENEAVLEADEPMYAALAMRARELGAPPPLDSLDETKFLQDLAQDFFAQYSALIARFAMMEDGTTSSTAIANMMQRRLIVRAIPTHFMAALLGICLALTIASMLLAPKYGFLPRDPGSIIDTAVLLAHSRPLLQSLLGVGGADERAVTKRLAGTTFHTSVDAYEDNETANLGYFRINGGTPSQHRNLRYSDPSTWRQPVALTGIIRLLFALVLSISIIGLEVSYRISIRHDGLRTITSDTAYIAWTAIPASLLLLMAVYVDAVDSWTRIISPFTNLYGQSDFSESVGLNVIDVWKPVAWMKAIKMRDLGVLATVSGAMFVPLLVVTSAPLFEPVPVDEFGGLALRGKDFFANRLAFSTDDPICIGCSNDTTVAAMVLRGNASYPTFTFEDLNLQGVSLEGVQRVDDELQISVRLPAIRPNMTCRVYLTEEISTNLTLDLTLGDLVNPLRIDLEGEPCRGKSEARSSNAIIGTAWGNSSSSSRAEDNVFFGVALEKTNATAQCSDWLYIWGELADANTVNVAAKSISAIACNESIIAVDTDVILHGANLRIETVQPPVPNERTRKNTTVALAPLNYTALPSITTPQLFDPFFALLGVSRFSVPTELLGDPSRDAAARVQAAVLRQHGVIRAQSLNFKSRRHLSSRGTFPGADGGLIMSGLDPNAAVSQAVPTFSANRITQRVRLQQDEVATRILQCILGVVLLFHLSSWILTPKTILPRWPTNIASIAALLVEGNVWTHLPRVAEWQSKQELELIFQRGDEPLLFELGWDPPRREMRHKKHSKSPEGTFGIRVLRAPDAPPGEAMTLVPLGIRPVSSSVGAGGGGNDGVEGEAVRYRRPTRMKRKGSEQGSAKAWWA